jgi:DNA polymerase-3 subunit beta
VAEEALFKIHRSQLLPALSAVFEAVDRRGTIPILGNVLLRPIGSELRLRGTDLTIEVETSCDLLEEAAPTSGITVSGEALREIVKNLPESAEVSFLAADHSGQVKIQAGRSRFTLLTLPQRDFPSISDSADGEALTIEIAPFIDALTKVLYAIKDDQNRPYLAGAFLIADGNNMSVVGCDGHNLAVVRLSSDEPAKFPGVITPFKTVKAIKKLFGESKGRVELVISDVMIKMTCGNVTIFSKLVDGTYPDYVRVIPTRNDKQTVCSVSALRSAVSRVCLVANDLEKDTVRLSVEPGTMRVIVKTTEGEAADEDIAIEYDGDPLEIGFNGRYLMALLGSISTQDVKILLSDNGTAGLFQPTIDSDEQFVLMPKRW